MQTSTNTNKKERQLIPPFRFCMVEQGIYRGSYPVEKNFRFLKRLIYIIILLYLLLLIDHFCKNEIKNNDINNTK